MHFREGVPASGTGCHSNSRKRDFFRPKAATGSKSGRKSYKQVLPFFTTMEP